MQISGPILALDSSTTTGSVAVAGRDGELLAEVVLNVAGAHSAALLPAADQALRSAGLAPRDLAAVVVGGGPGSFTGLRIAAATAKGMVRALRLPLLAYPSLMAAAVGGWVAGEVCALFDARRRDVYLAHYRFARGPENGPDPVTTLVQPTAATLDEVIERFAGGAPVFAGDAAWRHRDELRGALGAHVLPPELGMPRAAHLLWLARNAPEAGRVEDPAAWEPDYVRAAGAERIAAAGGSAPPAP